MTNLNLAPNRAILATWPALGRKIFSVKREPIDLKWNDRVRTNDVTRTVAPLYKYFVESIEIQGIRVVPSPDGGPLFVEINEDPNLQFKLAPAKFRKVTMEAIAEAVESKDNSSIGREPILFDELEPLVRQLAKLNGANAAICEKIAEEHIAMSKFLTDLNKNLIVDMEAYYDEIGTPIEG